MIIRATWHSAIPSRNVWDAMSRYARGGAKKRYRRDWYLLTLSAIGRRQLSPPYKITFTRISPGKLDDDNLSGAFKPCRDGVADALGVDDASTDISWFYAQERGPSGARLEIEEMARLPD